MAMASKSGKAIVKVATLAFSPEKMQKNCLLVSSLLKALSHPQRLMILATLVEGEKSVSEIQEVCEISQSQVSQFLARMKAEGLLDCRADGKFRYYSIADERLASLVRAIHSIYCK